jgi:hypothetical protein
MVALHDTLVYEELGRSLQLEGADISRLQNRA